MKSKFLSKTVLASVLFISPSLSHATGQIMSGETIFSSVTFNVMLGIVIFLLFIIVGITRALKGVSKSNLFEKSTKNNSAGKTMGVIFLLFLTEQLSASNAQADKWSIAGLDMWIFFFMLSIILLEGIVIVVLCNLELLGRNEE